MINILLLLVLSIEMGSVATEQRSSALFVNPAGLGINAGSEMLYEHTFYDSWSKIGISLGNIGFGMNVKKGSNPLFITGTSFTIKDYLCLGYNYNFGSASGHRVGGMFRPKKFISLGLTTSIEDEPEMQGGIAIRPFTDRFTFSCDAIRKADVGNGYICSLLYGIALEPIDGINLLGKYDGKESWKVGLEISFGNLKIGGLSSPDHRHSGASRENKSVSVILSDATYPTFLHTFYRKDKIAELTIKGDYPEMKKSAQYFVWSKQEPAFYNLLTAIDTLGKRKDVAGLFINFEPHSMGIAQREELRKELLKFKARGKKLITFSEAYGFGSYYLSSVADYIILTPLGDVTIPGLVFQSLHLKGTMDKLGVEMDIERVGKYKSAAELFERESMSEEEKEQLNVFLDDLWNPMLTEIADGRNIEVSKFEELINNKIFLNSDDALSSRLVDTLAYWDEVDSVLKRVAGKEIKRKKIGEILKQKNIPRQWLRAENSKIAVIIAEGNINTGESGSDWLFGDYIGSTTMREVIKKVEKDKTIKAVVFRVNSGGGSALASELILHSIKKLSAKKPVIVSMSNVAASGGYYIACSGNKVMADRATITGSIGIIGMFPVLKGLYDKLGISWDVVKRGEHADAGLGLAHLSPEERARFKEEIEWGYDKFITRVAEGRKLTKAQVDSIAQGRIWSGKSAKDIGLIDEIGGLSDAIEIAKKEAKIKTAEIVIYPEPKERFSLEF